MASKREIRVSDRSKGTDRETRRNRQRRTGESLSGGGLGVLSDGGGQREKEGHYLYNKIFSTQKHLETKFYCVGELGPLMG